MDNKIFTYQEACDLLDEVRDITTEAHNRLQELRQKADSLPPQSKQAKKLGEWINTAIHQWAEEILSVGALPKGLWTVDFDSGKGFYYCWTLNEATLSFFHNYEEGFMGRKPLTDIQDDHPPLLLI